VRNETPFSEGRASGAGQGNAPNVPGRAEGVQVGNLFSPAASRIEVRRAESGSAAELYITATPSPNLPPAEQALELFPAIAGILQRNGARILIERIFATDAAHEVIGAVRRRAYGELDDGVAPVRLAVPPGAYGEFSGVQIHAVRCAGTVQKLALGREAVGRMAPMEGGRYVALGGLTALEFGPSCRAQARAMFEKAEAVLADLGADLRSVARTWLWLGDILSWYGDLNDVRTQLFTSRGLVNSRHAPRLPASTGIGMHPAGEPMCALDLVAVLGDPGAIEYCNAAGMQDSAFNYGSAFSRAARARTPAGPTVYVSGTAAIDCQGQTQNPGEGAAQIDATMSHVRAVLRDMQCGDADVVHAIAYCTTPEVEAAFLRVRESIPWPWITVIADICRPDLLFEVEATAIPGASNV
jgi:enamine deaminase RidA (YjgF/YER057c/UK114 family)